MSNERKPAATDPSGDQPAISRRTILTGASALSVAALPIVGGLSACTTGDKNPSKDQTLPEDPLGIPGGPKTTPIKGVPYPPGYVGPIASKKGPCTKDGKKVTLKVVVPQDPRTGNLSTNPATKRYEEQTKVHIDWQVISGGADSRTKVNAMIASGDLPDVFNNTEFTLSEQYLYGQQGLLIPLQDLIEEYCPETKRIFRDYPNTKKVLTAPDGNIYTMPYVSDCFQCGFASRTWIYTPWMEKLGLDMPQTTDEFLNVLRAFKTRDPNGDRSTVIPLTGPNGKYGGFANFFMGSFLYNSGPYQNWLYLDNGKVNIAVDKPEWREGWRYMRQLISEGLLAKEAFTQTADQLKRQTNHRGSVIVGAVAGSSYWNSFMEMDTTDPNARWRDYHAVPILEGPNGVRVTGWNYYNWIFPQTRVYNVTKACKNPAVAVMWADSQYELTNFLTNHYGIDNETGEDRWRWAKDGEVAANGKQAMWFHDSYPPPVGTWWGTEGVIYNSKDLISYQGVDPESPGFAKPLDEATEEAYYPYREKEEQQVPLYLYYTAEQAATVADVSTALQSQVAKMNVQFSLGQANIDDDRQWQTYVDSVKKIGSERLIQATQAAYDAWVKANRG